MVESLQTRDSRLPGRKSAGARPTGQADQGQARCGLASVPGLSFFPLRSTLSRARRRAYLPRALVKRPQPRSTSGARPVPRIPSRVSPTPNKHRSYHFFGIN